MTVAALPFKILQMPGVTVVLPATRFTDGRLVDPIRRLFGRPGGRSVVDVQFQGGSWLDNNVIRTPRRCAHHRIDGRMIWLSPSTTGATTFQPDSDSQASLREQPRPGGLRNTGGAPPAGDSVRTKLASRRGPIASRARSRTTFAAEFDEKQPVKLTGTHEARVGQSNPSGRRTRTLGGQLPRRALQLVRRAGGATERSATW